MSDQDKATRIEVSPNGPLLVHNCDAITGSDGEPLEAKPVMALCRCGHSENKPFCDGSHRRVNFQG